MVGLGNPGAEFAGTRHNAGAEPSRCSPAATARRLRPEKGSTAVVAEVRIGGRPVALAVPKTYMNESGSAVRRSLRRFGIDDPARLVVVHDELDLPPGSRPGQGGGRHGRPQRTARRSRPTCTRDDFIRVRIGIGKPPGRRAGADYVLRRPSRRERDVLDVGVDEAADAVEVHRSPRASTRP